MSLLRSFGVVAANRGVLTRLALHIGRIAAEERVLGADPACAAYCQRVRWRLVPGLY